MSKFCFRPALLLFLLTVACQALMAQVSPPERVPAAETSPSRKATRVHQAPCWQVAGISQSALQQRKFLQQQAHAEVRSVCGDSSLTVQQKRAQIQQIRQRTKQQVEGLITPSQQEALQACTQSRGRHAGGGHSTAGHAGPCGELPPPGGHGHSPNSEQDPDD